MSISFLNAYSYFFRSVFHSSLLTLFLAGVEWGSLTFIFFTHAGQELDEARAEYRACVAEMRELCRNIAMASEKIRLETEILRREENSVRDQELKLLETSERVERKESQYRDKGIFCFCRFVISLSCY